VAGDAHGDAPVLGHALLGDIQARHDLQARHEQRAEHALRRQDLGQHAVDAVADAELVLEGLDVDIRGLLAHRLRQDRVDQADDRRIVLRVHEVAGIGDLLREARQIDVRADVRGHLLRLAVVALVGAGERALELRRRQCSNASPGPSRRRSSSSTSRRASPCAGSCTRIVGVDDHPVRLRKGERQLARRHRGDCRFRRCDPGRPLGDHPGHFPGHAPAISSTPPAAPLTASPGARRARRRESSRARGSHPPSPAVRAPGRRPKNGSPCSRCWRWRSRMARYLSAVAPASCLVVADDRRANEDQQVGLGHGHGVVAEQAPEQRDVTEQSARAAPCSARRP
jgi:hypothetical protein